mgnify:CR=1 FL=1
MDRRTFIKTALWSLGLPLVSWVKLPQEAKTPVTEASAGSFEEQFVFDGAVGLSFALPAATPRSQGKLGRVFLPLVTR